MNYPAYINIVIGFLAILAAYGSWVIFGKVGGRGRILTSAAFTWAAIVRWMSVWNDWNTGWNFPVTQLQIGFWVLVTVGIWMLILEINRITKGKRKTLWERFADWLMSAWRD